MKISENSRVFKEVESVLGYEGAVKHLAIATENIPEEHIQFIINYDIRLAFAFSWEDTDQGYDFWSEVQRLVSKYGVEE